MASKDWPLVPLGELTENFDGRRMPVKGNDRKPGPYPYYGASGIVDRVDGYLFDGEYLLIGEDGENLRTRQTPIAFIATGKFWVNNHAHIVRGNHRADTRFLSYVLSQTEISGYLTGSTMPKLTQGNLNRLLVIAPPLAEQKAIASILGALDDKIELNRRMNATLEAMARALFQSWFVDFDPVRSKLDGRKPEGMDKATAALFPDAFEESEAGQIPTGWRVDILENLTEVQGGFAFKSQDFIGAGAPVIKIKNIGDDHTVDVDDVEYISPDLAQQAEDFQLSDGDVLMAMTGAKVAKFGLLVNRDVRAVLNQRVARFVPRSQLQRPWFVYCSRLDENVLNQIVSRAEGSAQPNVSTAGIKAAQLVCPLPALVDRFNEIVHSLFTLTIKNTRESRTLATLRDTLLPKLLSGELSLASIPKVKA